MRVGIVGCGRIGKRHAKYLRELPGIELAGGYDASPAAARAFADEFKVTVHPRLDALLAGPIDAVSVCSPPAAHAESVAAALRKGLPVLCEKPLAARLSEVRDLPKDGRLACAFKFRHLSGATPLRDAIQSGRLGQIVGVRATAVSNLDTTGTWFSDPAQSGGGVMLDNGVHLIDLVRYLVGSVSEVWACTAGGTRKLPVEETATVLMRLSNGAAAHLFLSWEAPGPMPPLIEVYGTKGYARLGYELEIFDANGKDRTLHVPAGDADIWREVMADFVAFASGRQPPRATFEDGFSALAVVDAAYRASQSGHWERPVAWK